MHSIWRLVLTVGSLIIKGLILSGIIMCMVKFAMMSYYKLLPECCLLNYILQNFSVLIGQGKFTLIVF